VEIEVLTDADAVAHEAARKIAEIARKTVAESGRFVMALSGGTTPWKMLRALGHEDIPWEYMHVFQVDERIAPQGHRDRNLTHLIEILLEFAALNEDHIYAMPVEMNDLESAAICYYKTLCQLAGSPPILDLVHLGLGVDGHTASLVPNDEVLKVDESDVAISGIYQGRQRMTLTYPIINRSRNILWVITGKEKVSMLKRLLVADSSFPAGRICQDNAFVLADMDAFGDVV
jgi:6-phosphogluconolactonase